MVKKDLWDALEAVAQSITTPWLLGGDFNAILNENEKQGGSHSGISSCKLFNKFFDDFCFKDVGFQGSMFTWNRGLFFGDSIVRSAIACGSRWHLKRWFFTYTKSNMITILWPSLLGLLLFRESIVLSSF